METLRRNPIHRALNRPDLIAGCERELMLTSAFISIALVMVALSLFASIVGCIFWLASTLILRKLAKADPFMSKIYLRHIKYAAFYGARSTPFALSAIHKR